MNLGYTLYRIWSDVSQIVFIKRLPTGCNMSYEMADKKSFLLSKGCRHEQYRPSVMDSSVHAVWGYIRAMRDIHVVSSFRLVSVRRTRQGHMEQPNTWPYHAVSRIIQAPFCDINLFLLSFVLAPQLRRHESFICDWIRIRTFTRARAYREVTRLSPSETFIAKHLTLRK